MNMFKKSISVVMYSALSASALALVGCSDSGGAAGAQPVATQSPSNAGTLQDSENAKFVAAQARGAVGEIFSNGSLLVVGQTVAVSGATTYIDVSRTQLRVGDVVIVDGELNSNGHIVANRVQLDSSNSDTIVVTGVVTNVDKQNETFQIGSTTVRFDSIDLEGININTLENGVVVTITSDSQSFNANGLQLTAGSVTAITDGNTIVTIDGITTTTNGNTTKVTANEVSTIGPEGTVVVDQNGVKVDSGDQQTTVTTDGVTTTNNSNTTKVTTEGVSTTGPDGTVVIDQSGVKTDVGGQEINVTTDGININGKDIGDMITDEVNKALDGVLDLGDLSSYDYRDIKVAHSSSCLQVGNPSSLLVTGKTDNSMNQVVEHNLSSYVSLDSDSNNIAVVAAGDTGIFVSMSEQDIVEVQLNAGDTTLTHYLGAIHASVSLPVVLTKQTAEWCSFIVFEQDSCTAITNTVGSTTLSAGQTVVDTSEAGTLIDAGNGVMIDTKSDRIVSVEGVADIVNTQSGLSVSGCTLSNPNNMPVIRVN